MKYRWLAVLAAVAVCLGCGVPDPSLDLTPAPRITSVPSARGLVIVPTLAPAQTAVGRLPPANAVATPARPALSGAVIDQKLEKGLEDLIANKKDDYGVYVKDLGTRRVAAVNEDKVFYAASLFKVPVMFEVFRQHALGIIDLNESLTVTEYYAAFDLGTQATREGDQVTIADALRFMMSVSDNTSANMLLDRVGSPNVSATLAALGARDTNLLTEDLPLTAADMGILLETIAAGAGLDEESKAQMLALMASEAADNGLAAGVPRGTIVAHKTGNWDNATHDAGVVFSPRGSYVIVVLSSKDHDTALIRDISSFVYLYFNPAGR